MYIFHFRCLSSPPDGVPDAARDQAMRRAHVYVDSIAIVDEVGGCFESTHVNPGNI